MAYNRLVSYEYRSEHQGKLPLSRSVGVWAFYFLYYGNNHVLVKDDDHKIVFTGTYLPSKEKALQYARDYEYGIVLLGAESVADPSITVRHLPVATYVGKAVRNYIKRREPLPPSPPRRTAQEMLADGRKRKPPPVYPSDLADHRRMPSF